MTVTREVSEILIFFLDPGKGISPLGIATYSDDAAIGIF